MNNGLIEIENKTFRIIKPISEGGFGTVYLAEPEIPPHTHLALKKMVV